jgi:hypothetical protein
MKVLMKIENFDKNKSYPVEQPLTKFIPIYGNKCSCQYGYKCDDEDFDSKKPVGYIEVPLTDSRIFAIDK